MWINSMKKNVSSDSTKTAIDEHSMNLESVSHFCSLRITESAKGTEI